MTGYGTPRNYLVSRAAEITDVAAREGRNMTAAEKKEASDLLDQIAEIDDREALKKAFDSGDYSAVPTSTMRKFASAQREKQELSNEIRKLRGAPDGAGGVFGHAVKAAGFDRVERPSVTMPTMSALGGVKNTLPSAELWSQTSPGLVPMGRDERFLWRRLASKDIGTDTAITDFRQTARTLSGNAVQRELDASSEKAALAISVEHIVDEVAQFAVVISDIPNSLIDSIDGFSAFLSNEGAYQVQTAIDQHVLDTIIDAPVTGVATGTTMIEQVRNGVAAMRLNGASPTLLVVDPADGVTLDLATSGTSTPLLFPTRDSGGASPLWGLTIVESPAMIGEPPLLIDVQMLGVLYLGALRTDVDPYSSFSKNLSNLRVEVNARMHVRDIRGAYSLGPMS
jgi:hypothetical protein